MYGGNSGGPVMSANRKVVGVAFQSLTGSRVENIGYVIPINIVKHFLEDIRRNNGKYKGWCSLGIQYSALENKEFQKSLGMSSTPPSADSGVLVNKIIPSSSAYSYLQENDVLMAINGIQVSSDGTVAFRKGERVNLNFLISSLFEHDVAKLSILRNRQRLIIEVPLKIGHYLVPHHFSNKLPPYVIVSGLVFTKLSSRYLHAERAFSGYQNSAISYLITLAAFGQYNTHPTSSTAAICSNNNNMTSNTTTTNNNNTNNNSSCSSTDDTHVDGNNNNDVIILSRVLCHRHILGYEHYENLHLRSLNNNTVSSLSHLHEIVSSETLLRSPYLTFEFGPLKTVIVLNSSSVEAVTKEVCLQNSIPLSHRL
jgi:hypothetical protein